MKIMGLIALALGIGVTESMAYLFQYNVEGTGTWFAIAMVLFGLVISVAGTVLFLVLSGMSEAVMDKINFHYEKSIFSNSKYEQFFWNPEISWRNKYKDNAPENGPAFFGSATFLVFLTDAWHFMKFARNSFLVCAFGSFGFIEIHTGDAFINALLYWLVIFGGLFMRGVFFEITFSRWLTKHHD